MGATAPSTLAGAFALSNAECLSGLVVSQLCSPGAPVIYSGGCGPMDMQTAMTPYNAPETYLGELAGRDMSRFYQLPNYTIGGMTDAKLLDEQAAAETALSLFQATIVGSNIIHDVGYMDSGLTACWEQIVLGNELIDHLKKYTRGFEISTETLALDILQAVGPGGNFLTENHTLRHFRDIWYPQVLDRQEYSQWQMKE